MAGDLCPLVWGLSGTLAQQGEGGCCKEWVLGVRPLGGCFPLFRPVLSRAEGWDLSCQETPARRGSPSLAGGPLHLSHTNREGTSGSSVAVSPVKPLGELNSGWGLLVSRDPPPNNPHVSPHATGAQGASGRRT